MLVNATSTVTWNVDVVIDVYSSCFTIWVSGVDIRTATFYMTALRHLTLSSNRRVQYRLRSLLAEQHAACDLW